MRLGKHVLEKSHRNDRDTRVLLEEPRQDSVRSSGFACVKGVLQHHCRVVRDLAGLGFSMSIMMCVMGAGEAGSSRRNSLIGARNAFLR